MYLTFIIFLLEFIADFEHQPTALLRDETRRHAALVIGLVEQVMNIQSQLEATECVVGTDVHEQAGRYLRDFDRIAALFL